LHHPTTPRSEEMNSELKKNILLSKPKVLVEHYFDSLCSALSVTPEELRKNLPTENWDTWESWPISHKLNDKWINKIKRDKNRLDELYDDPDYLYTAIECYTNCSQRSTKRFLKMLTKFDRDSLPKSIVDVAGGAGLTTLLLRQGLDSLFPGNKIKVVYHNFGNDENSVQLRFAKSVLEGVEGIEYVYGEVPDAEAYILFEFLEHLPAPVKWLNDLLSRTSPKIISHASSFSHPQHAGHFELYDCSENGDGSKIVNGRSSAAGVTKFLKKRGYTKIAHKICWNGIPQFWALPDTASHFHGED